MLLPGGATLLAVGLYICSGLVRVPLPLAVTPSLKRNSLGYVLGFLPLAATVSLTMGGSVIWAPLIRLHSCFSIQNMITGV
jgi:hypothetical protein